MRIVVVSMVRNEADVIELFVRWHLRIADHLLVADHASGDGTGEILAALRDEGLPLTVVSCDGAAYEQSRVTSALARRAAQQLAADWVLPFDADELLETETGEAPRRVIERLDPRLVHRVGWRNYVPRPQDAAGDTPLLERIAHRNRSERTHHKLLIPGALLRKRATWLGTGNHRLLQRSWLKRRKLQSVDAPDLWLAHFPVRSVEQLRTKTLVGWLAQLASAERHGDPVRDSHLHEMYGLLRRGEVPGADEMARFARFYSIGAETASEPELVRAPLTPPGGPIALRYGHLGRVSAVSALIDFSERLAREAGASHARSLRRRWRSRFRAG
jgi:hypothetical protein